MTMNRSSIQKRNINYFSPALFSSKVMCTPKHLTQFLNQCFLLKASALDAKMLNAPITLVE